MKWVAIASLTDVHIATELYLQKDEHGNLSTINTLSSSFNQDRIVGECYIY